MGIRLPTEKNRAWESDYPQRKTGHGNQTTHREKQGMGIRLPTEQNRTWESDYYYCPGNYLLCVQTVWPHGASLLPSVGSEVPPVACDVATHDHMTAKLLRSLDLGTPNRLPFKGIPGSATDNTIGWDRRMMSCGFYLTARPHTSLLTSSLRLKTETIETGPALYQTYSVYHIRAFRLSTTFTKQNSMMAVSYQIQQ